MPKHASISVQHKKETLAQFAERYRILSHPKNIQMLMAKFTALMDTRLRERLESLPTHPKDTGLMKKRWVLPRQYLLTHTGRAWQVYLNNTATVGEQAKLKDAQLGRTHRKKKRIGRHNLKRYMPWVDKRTKFYTKQLRVIRQTVDREFKEFINNVLWQASAQGLLSPAEAEQYGKEFT